MLRRLMDANPKTFDAKFSVVFENTGKEYDETLDFVNAVETNWGVPVTWLEYCRTNDDHDVRVVNYQTAARAKDKRGPFDEMLEWANTLPNVMQRRCSGQLKERTLKRYLKKHGMETWDAYIGIRIDEADRCLELRRSCPKYINLRFPLCDDKISKCHVDNFWSSQPFRLNIPNHKGNCDLCFLKAKWKRLSIMREEPERAAWWIAWEKKFAARTGDRAVTTGRSWIDGVSYEGMLAESQHPEFDFNEQDVPCSCAVGGYRDADDEGQNESR